MVFGVKYCGGCNPRYNRTTFFDKVKEVCYDQLIVICGCPSKCADISQIQVTGETFKISEENQLEQLIAKIQQR